MATLSRGTLIDRLARRAATEPGFRQELMEHPKTVIERELGCQLPTWCRVKIIDESECTFHVVLPKPGSRWHRELQDAVDGTLATASGHRSPWFSSRLRQPTI